MNEYNFNVNFENGKIKTSLKKLVQNDYNSTKLNFTFDKEGRVVFKMLYPDGVTTYITQVENNELILEPGTLSHEGDYEVEISLYTEDSKLTAYATKGFYVRNELIDTDDVVSSDDRVPILDALINEVEIDKAYVEGIREAAERGDFNGTNGQDGRDGIDGTNGVDGITPTIGDNGNWYLGETDTGKPSRGEKGESGEKGEPGSDGATPIKGIDYFTSEDIAEIEGDIEEIIGDLQNLDTTDKTTLVNAINEVVTDMGDLSIKELERGVYNIDELDDGIYVQEATRTIKLNLPRRSDGHDHGEEYVQYELLGILIKASSVSDEPSIMGHYIFTTMDENNNYVMTIVQGYYEKFEDPAGIEEPIIIGEYETAYNAAKKYTNGVVGDLSELDTTDKTNLVSAINEVVGSSSSYVAGEGINISNNEISSTMPIYQISPTSEGDPFVIQNKPAGIYIFRKNSYSPNTIHFKAYDDTSIEYFGVGSGFLVLTNTSLDKSKSQWKTVGYFYGSVYDDHFTNSNYYVTGMKEINIWQETGGFNTYDLIMNNNAGYKFMNPEARAKITQTHTYNVLPESTVVPTNDNQFTNKKYVDDAVASAGGGDGIKTITENTVMQNLESGIYRVDTTNNIILTLGTSTSTTSGTVSVTPGTIFVWTNALDNLTTSSTQYSLLYFMKPGLFANQFCVYRVLINNPTSDNPTNGAVAATTISLNDHTNYLTKAGAQEITGVKTFTALPETSVTPTTNNQMVNKKYVDDAITAAITDALGGSY